MAANPNTFSRFRGKAALVSGGASGIGRAAAERLASEGARVFIADLNAAMADQAVAQIRAAGGSADHVHVDLADDNSVEKCAREVAAQVPALHLLVNNAAILRQGRIEDGSWIENWEIETRIGLRGWVMMTQLLLPLLKAEGGAIVNLSSEGGYLGRPGMWVYDAVKAAIVSATKTMAQEFTQYGIRVNAVAPGWIVTEMHFAHHPDPAAYKKELEQTPIDSCLMQRRGGAEEVASPIAFLLSDDASYITGTTLHVDGGRVGMNLGNLGLLE